MICISHWLYLIMKLIWLPILPHYPMYILFVNWQSMNNPLNSVTHMTREKVQSKSHQIKYFNRKNKFFFHFKFVKRENGMIGAHLEITSTYQKHCHRRRFFLCCQTWWTTFFCSSGVSYDTAKMIANLMAIVFYWSERIWIENKIKDLKPRLISRPIYNASTMNDIFLL